VLSLLDQVARSSLDPTIPTPVLRINLGMTEEVAQMAHGDRDVAYIGMQAARDLTGLGEPAIYEAVAHPACLVSLAGRGTPYVAVGGHEGEIEGWHGLAASWSLDKKVEVVSRHTGWRKVLDPGADLWSRSHRAWRLALCLRGAHPDQDVEVTTKQIAQMLGCSYTTASKAASDLCKRAILMLRHVGRGRWAYTGSYPEHEELVTVGLLSKVKHARIEKVKRWVVAFLRIDPDEPTVEQQSAMEIALDWFYAQVRTRPLATMSASLASIYA
jgi:hypothetical protein